MKLGLVFHTFFSLILIIMLGCVNQTVAAQGLKYFQWENRLLVVNAEADTDEKYNRILEDYLFDVEALKERKLLLIRVRDKEIVIINSHTGSAYKLVDKVWQERISKDKRQIWLVGLDGGIKKTWNILPSPSEVFDIIDAMPIRLSELKKFK